MTPLQPCTPGTARGIVPVPSRRPKGTTTGDAPSPTAVHVPGRSSGCDTRRPRHRDAYRDGARRPDRDAGRGRGRAPGHRDADGDAAIGRAGCADQASAFTEYETSEMTPPLLLLSMLVGVNSLSLLSPRAHAAAMAPPLLTRHTTPSLRLLRPPRLCMASVPPASEGSPEVGLPLSMTRVQLKYFVLLLLVLQNSVVALVTQATRMKTGVMYSSTAAVLASEVLKMPVCLALIARDVGVAGVRRELHQKVVEPWRDTLTMAVPALCYCLQNALFFVALSNLSAASYQLWSQSKTLSTALFFVLLLGKRLRKRQWFALVLLTAGVALVQYADTGTALRVGRPLVGILAVLASSLLSGFSNVYLEKRIKLGDSSGSGRTVRRAILNRCKHVTPLLPQLSARVPRRAQVSIWIRNVQLGLFSIPQSAALCLADRAAVTSAGIGALFAGFSPAVWSVVGLKAFGGLLVAAVVSTPTTF